MSIHFNEQKKIFKLDSKGVSYILQVYKENCLAHLYFGAYIPDDNLTDFAERHVYASFSPQPDTQPPYTFSPDTCPMEIGCNGGADLRIASVQIRNADGNACTDFRYVSHKIVPGKPALPGLPALYANTDDECETLEITMRDEYTGAEAVLLYTVFEKQAAITRSMIIKNTSDKPFVIERAMSFCMDMNGCDYDLISLYGRHVQEREYMRRPLAHGTQGIGSR